jgi:hypothetical protein
MKKRPVLLLRACYWFGATFDAAMVIPMLCPSVGARVFRIDGFRPGVEYRYAMFMGASLMLGWTMLTRTRFTSLNRLEEVFHWVEPAALVGRARECALGLESHRTEPLASGKAFEVLCFRKVAA